MKKRLLAAPFVLTAMLSPAFGDTSPPKKLPAADPGSNLDRRPDGTCWQHAKMNCPPNAKCNPPAPHQVECPPARKPS